MTLRPRFALALLVLLAAGAQAQTVRLQDFPVYPTSPTTQTRVQARVFISGCGDLTVTPVVKDNLIELRHRIEPCPIVSPTIEDSIDIGFLTAGDYLLQVVHLAQPSVPLIEDEDVFTVGTAPGALCTPGPLVACLFDRFQVEVRYKAELTDGVPNRSAKVLNVSELRGTIYESALFYLDDPTNAEVMVKMLDQGTDAQGHPVVAVLYGTATPLKIEIGVRDNAVGITKTYRIPLGQMQGGADFAAFLK